MDFLTLLFIFSAVALVAGISYAVTARQMKVKREMRRKAEEEARIKGIEAQRQAEEETRRKAEEEARVEAEEKKRQAAEEAQLKAEEEARVEAEEKKRRAEEEAQRKAEEAQREAEEEARLKAEEEARVEAEEKKRRAEEEAQRKAEEAQREAEEETRRKAEEDARVKAEEKIRQAEEEAQRKAEEAQRQVEEEARRKAQEEARVKAEEEKSRAEEEARRKVDQEARIKYEEEVKPQNNAVIPELIENVIEPGVLKEGQEKGQRRRIPLDRIPGRRGYSEQDYEGLASREGVHTPKPEIICREQERQWILAIELPEDFHKKPNLAIVQNEEPLSEDPSRKGYWHLNQAYGTVSVHSGEMKIFEDIYLGASGNNYILFKLGGPGIKLGRRVRATSTGAYLAVVPGNWEPDDASEMVSETIDIDKYRGYFFVIEKPGERKLIFHTLGNQPVFIGSETARFELTGNRLNDASEDMGPLFGGKPPQICGRDIRVWTETGTIVVGEEVSDTGLWSKAYPPKPDEIIQELPSEITERQCGWYFLRFYDRNSELTESLDFRFVRALKEIRIHHPEPRPSEAGHQAADIEFIHEPECTIEPADVIFRDIEIKRPDNSTTYLSILPSPEFDKTRWRVSCKDGSEVDVTLLIERLWWTIGDENKIPSEWKDKSVMISREDLSAVSTKALWIRFPRKRWCDGIQAGFDNSRTCYFPVRVSEDTVAIPLREFSDSEARNWCGTTVFRVSTGHPNRLSGFSVGQLTVRWYCRICNKPLEEADLRDHASTHTQGFFRQLNYSELREYLPDLPTRIYLCHYCHSYISEFESHPTSAIAHHIETECKKVDRSQGSSHISFRIVNDVDEIRENYNRNIPHIYKCKECDEVFRNPAPDRFAIHMTEKHLNMLFRLQ